MMQRVAAVDSLFKDAPRLYLQLSWRRRWRRVVQTRGLVRIEYVNFFRHHRYIRRCFQDATCIYVHSVWNALRSFPYFRRFRNKTIVDMHGVVPEEMTFLGSPVWAKVCAFIERRTAKNVRLFVVPTHKMAQHFLKKYPDDLDPSGILVMPMFNHVEEVGEVRRGRETRGFRLIYAGGVHRWQNIDLMLKTLRRLADARPDVRTNIYVPSGATRDLSDKVTASGLSGVVDVGSLTHGELLREYGKFDAGFVLRDDTLLNRVAMPTKLLEYLSYGVVPIVLSPEIGDFLEYGYKYLTIEDLFSQDKLQGSVLDEMRRNNFESLAAIQAETSNAKNLLKRFVRNPGSVSSPYFG